MLTLVKRHLIAKWVMCKCRCVFQHGQHFLQMNFVYLFIYSIIYLLINLYIIE